MASVPGTVEHIYSPLNTRKREVRVLTIDDQLSINGLVACNLKVVSLDDQPAYTTLSYCWGAPEPAATILINSVRWSVAPNLAAALKHFRRTEDAKSTPIWIDALCINQSDLEERSAQVAMMTSIYAQAGCVHVWLGNDMGPSLEAMLTLEEVFTTDMDDPRDLRLQRWCQQLAKHWYQHSREHVARKLRHLIEIGNNSYWQRMWILQEVSFARNVIMHGKEQRVDLRPSDDLERTNHVGMVQLNIIFRELSAMINVHPESRLRLDQGAYSQPGHNDNIRGLTARVGDLFPVIMRVNWNKAIGGMQVLEGDIGAGAFSLTHPEIFVTYRKMLSTDPRDKIYGLLGFVRELRDLTPDYAKSISAIYCEATSNLMHAAKDMTFLHQACSRNSQIPSWVPDYSRPCMWPTLAVVDRSASASAVVPSSVSFDVDAGGTLLVRGIVFDNIKIVVSHTPVNHTKSETLHDIWEVWKTACPSLLDEVVDESGRRLTKIGHLFGYTSYHSLGTAADFSEGIPTVDLNEFQDLFENFELFSSVKGHIGIAPKGLIISGDSLAIIAGASLPFAVGTCGVHGRRLRLKLKAPVVLDGDVVGHKARTQCEEWTNHVALAEHTEWINGRSVGLHGRVRRCGSFMDGALVVAEAVRKFNDPSRVEDVFEDLAII